MKIHCKIAVSFSDECGSGSGKFFAVFRFVVFRYAVPGFYAPQTSHKVLHGTLVCHNDSNCAWWSNSYVLAYYV